MAHTANSLIERNRRRWEENLRAQTDAQQSRPDMERCSHPLAPTAGHVFCRPNPRCPENGLYDLPWDRTKGKNGGYVDEPRGYPQFYRLDDKSREKYAPDQLQSMEERSKMPKMQNGRTEFLKAYGITELCGISVKPWSVFKYRIPNTSVVNKVGDCRLCLCAGPKMTAAQWIWWCNLLCFLVHTAMVIVTLHFAYWRWDKSMWRDTNHMLIRIYRVSSIPSPEMIANNETEVWDNTTRWSDRFYLKDNGMPVRLQTPTLHSQKRTHVRAFLSRVRCPSQVNFATLTLSFFAISAIFHFLACVMGLWEALYAALAALSSPVHPTRTTNLPTDPSTPVSQLVLVLATA